VTKIEVIEKSMAIEKCWTKKGGDQNFSDGKSMMIKTLTTNVILRIKIGDA
jgi:hypothetical protein